MNIWRERERGRGREGGWGEREREREKCKDSAFPGWLMWGLRKTRREADLGETACTI